MGTGAEVRGAEPYRPGDHRKIGSPNWTARQKRLAFDWLQEVALNPASPPEARIVLDELHALASKAYPQASDGTSPRPEASTAPQRASDEASGDRSDEPPHVPGEALTHGHDDHCRCLACGYVGLVRLGSDVCPKCETGGALVDEPEDTAPQQASAPVGVEGVVDVDIPEPVGLEKAVREAVAEWNECRSPAAAQHAMFRISNDLRATEAARALAQQPAAVGVGLTYSEHEWLQYAIDHMRDDSEPEDLTCADVLALLLQRSTLVQQLAAHDAAAEQFHQGWQAGYWAAAQGQHGGPQE